MLSRIASLLFVAQSVGFAAVGDAWNSRNAVPSSTALRAAINTGSSFVVVGKHGTIVKSSNGASWNTTTSGVESNLNAIAWSGTLAVAAGEDGTVLTSPDASTWTATSTAQTTWRGAVWTGSQFVLAGDSGCVATSSTGVAWAFRYIGTMVELHAVASSGALVVIVGNKGFIASSPDAITWSTASTVTTNALNSIAYNGSTWVSVGDAGTVLRSTDGSSWTSSSSGVTTGLNQVLWDGSKFIAAGVDGAVITSSDGVSWAAISSGVTDELLTGVHSGGTTILLGDRGVALSSSDGASWTVRSSGPRETLHHVARGTSTWAAAGAGGTVATSSDGDAWVAQSTSVSATLHGIGWNGLKFVAIGDAGTVITSSDGSVWSTAPSGTTRALLGIASTPSQWVAVGEAGFIMTSASGTSWTAQSSGVAPSLRGVAWSGSRFVAVGDNGAITASSTGSSWSAKASGVSVALEAVAFGGDVFVAVGANGTVVTSPTGDSWTKRSLPATSTPFASLTGVVWNGVEFVAVGWKGRPFDPRAWVLTSYDGITWVERSISGASMLRSVGTNGSDHFAVGLDGAILQNVPAILPEVAFELAASSAPESAGTAQIMLTLSAPSTAAVKVSFSITSATATLGSTGDAVVAASPVVIIPGQTQGALTITIREDTIDESDETIALKLESAQGATLGVQRTHIFTILDNDSAPAFSQLPSNNIVAVGSQLSLTCVATGDPTLKYQWTRNNTNLSNAIASAYYMPAVSLAQAGTYRVKVTNLSGSITSDPAELAVVDTKASSTSLVFNNTVSFTVNAAGNNVTYQWTRDGHGDVIDDPSPAKRVSGATTKTLIIKALAGTDSGIYRCNVRTPFGSLNGGANTLNVIIPPVVHAPMIGTVMVSQFISVPVLADNSPTLFTITGLPAGISYSRSTGLISGRPLAPTSAPLKIGIVASNAAGSSGAPVIATMSVVALTNGIAGTYAGLIARDPSLNDNLGGRFTISITRAGVASGSIVNGRSAHVFVKGVDTSTLDPPSLSGSLKRSGKSDLVFELDLTTLTGAVTGTLHDTTGTASVNGWRNMLAPFDSLVGSYNAAIKLANANDEGQASIPQGVGFTRFNVSAAGLASGLARLADGTLVSFASTLRNTGSLIIFGSLYGGSGSLHGLLNVTPGVPTLVGSTGLSWFKAPQTLTAVRSYRAGFGPTDVSLFGAVYTPPAPGSIFMGLSSTADDVANAALHFTEGAVPDPANRIDVPFRVIAPAIRDPQTPSSNPGKVTISMNPLTGEITGSFTLVDMDTTVVPNKPITRIAPYYGLAVRDVDGWLRGFGHFQLQKMPDNSVLPATTIRTSPILSGKVMLVPAP